MSTVSEIISFVDRKFPNPETTSNKLVDLNDIYLDLYTMINRLKNDVEIYELSTIENQPTYTLPSNCRIENIQKVVVSTNTEGAEFDTYEYAGIEDDVTSGKYYGRAAEGTFFLFDDARPLQTAGLIVQIYYYKRPELFSESNLSAIPDLDSDYHELLKFGLIQSLVAQGHNPDTEIADYWQKKYDEKLKKVMESLAERYDSAPLHIKQANEWW